MGFSKKNHHHHDSKYAIEVAETDDKPYPLDPRKYNGCYNEWEIFPTTTVPLQTCLKCDIDAKMLRKDLNSSDIETVIGFN
jgi:hypothetical protein